MVIRNDVTINHHGMHVSTPSLKHNMPIGLEHREHYRTFIILNQLQDRLACRG